MNRPHPSEFSVEIKRRADGTWRVQIREDPAFWGEGGELRDALDALRKRAVSAVPSLGAPDADTLRGAAATLAAESAVERYLDETGDVASEEDPASNWDDVSVISFRRKPPPGSDPSGDPT